jgi:hypothetical protein
MNTHPKPDLRILALDAGPRSAAILLASCAGLLPRFDAAVVARTGRPTARELDRLDLLESLADATPVLATSRSVAAKVAQLLDQLHQGDIPLGAYVELATPVSTDQARTVAPARYTDRMREARPLLGLGWSRSDCETYLSTWGIEGGRP